MKVKELRELLKDAPDDAPVVVDGSDHSHYEANCFVTTMLVYDDDPGSMTEDHGPEYDDPGTTRVPCLLVR
jgi:hypothetical protein